MNLTKEYSPPIHERDDDELISIACSVSDEWQKEAIDQARQELIRRDISEEEQRSKLIIWRRKTDCIKFRDQKRKEINSKDIIVSLKCY